MKAVLVLLGCVTLVSLVAAKKNVVIDLSHHNGNVDLKAAQDDGITTVIHKCTQGRRFVDSKYKTNKAAAEKLGLTWAAYHFADGSDGALQAEHFLKNAGTVKRYIVDLEDNPQGTTVRKAQAEALVEKIKEKTGSYPIVYGNAYFLDALNSQVLAKCPLWLASYRSTPTLPKLWSSWLMWQYTDGTKGSAPHDVKGIGKVDRSYLNVDSLTVIHKCTPGRRFVDPKYKTNKAAAEKLGLRQRTILLLAAMEPSKLSPQSYRRCQKVHSRLGVQLGDPVRNHSGESSGGSPFGEDHRANWLIPHRPRKRLFLGQTQLSSFTQMSPMAGILPLHSHVAEAVELLVDVAVHGWHQRSSSSCCQRDR